MQTVYTYDALNRVTQINFTGGTPINFTYDQGTNGIGHLTQMTDGSGTTNWSYDIQGRVISKSQPLGKKFLTIQYAYDATGQLVSITYPSGNVVQFTYTGGLVTKLSVGGKALMSGIQYQPFGPANSWTWGNGAAYSRSFDLDSRLAQYPLGSRTRQVGYDAASRITAYTDSDPTRDQAFAYDALSRLSGFADPAGQETYQYDSDGNRLTLSQATLSDTYTYATNSNWLMDISGIHAETFQYDATGNTLSDGVNQFTYDGRGRLVQASNNQGVTPYVINGLGQRVAKLSAPGSTSGTYFDYDEAGHLVGEYGSNGKAIEETVYLGDMPVAVLVGNTNYFIYADQLNAPRAITDSKNKPVWQWEGNPFGKTPPNENPGGKGQGFTYNLRFPGQYFDSETGLHYNGFRDYNPNTGRYIESDPIGLVAGINTYRYVGGNPVSYNDPDGHNVVVLAAVGFGIFAYVAVQNLGPGSDFENSRTYNAPSGEIRADIGKLLESQKTSLLEACSKVVQAASQAVGTLNSLRYSSAMLGLIRQANSLQTEINQPGEGVSSHSDVVISDPQKSTGFLDYLAGLFIELSYKLSPNKPDEERPLPGGSMGGGIRG